MFNLSILISSDVMYTTFRRNIDYPFSILLYLFLFLAARKTAVFLLTSHLGTTYLLIALLHRTTNYQLVVLCKNILYARSIAS